MSLYPHDILVSCPVSILNLVDFVNETFLQLQYAESPEERSKSRIYQTKLSPVSGADIYISMIGFYCKGIRKQVTSKVGAYPAE